MGRPGVILEWMEQPIVDPMEDLADEPRSWVATEQEYLRFEAASPDRHEYRGGRIVEMAGGKQPHGRVAARFIVEIENRLRGRPCSVHGSDVAVHVAETHEYAYPDVSVACDPIEFFNPPDNARLLNPRLIVEVTSVSTEAVDRGDKFTSYRTIPSIEEYVLASSVRRQVETYYRNDDGLWFIGPTVTDAAAVVKLRSLAMEIPLADLYYRVDLPAPSPSGNTAAC
jgi:Uma2 family endonuclease